VDETNNFGESTIFVDRALLLKGSPIVKMNQLREAKQEIRESSLGFPSQETERMELYLRKLAKF
jgi:hypothetical protein